MLSRFPGSSIGLGLVLSFCIAEPVRALDLLVGLGEPSYVESFDGGNAFPTLPDEDPLALGGMTEFAVGDPLPGSPVFVGGGLAIPVVEVPGSAARLQSSGARVAIAPTPSTGSIGLYGRFDGFNLTDDPVNGAFQTVALTFRDLTLPNGVSAYLLAFGGGTLRIVVSNLGPSILGGYGQTFLSPTADAAIRAGSPFEIELLFDVDARTLQGSLRVGSELFLTPTTTHPSFDALDAIEDAIFVTTSTNNAAPAASISARLDHAEVFLPEPGGLTALLAPIGVLVGFARAKSRPRGGSNVSCPR